MSIDVIQDSSRMNTNGSSDYSDEETLTNRTQDDSILSIPTLRDDSEDGDERAITQNKPPPKHNSDRSEAKSILAASSFRQEPNALETDSKQQTAIISTTIASMHASGSHHNVPRTGSAKWLNDSDEDDDSDKSTDAVGKRIPAESKHSQPNNTNEFRAEPVAIAAAKIARRNFSEDMDDDGDIEVLESIDKSYNRSVLSNRGYTTGRSGAKSDHNRNAHGNSGDDDDEFDVHNNATNRSTIHNHYVEENSNDNSYDVGASNTSLPPSSNIRWKKRDSSLLNSSNPAEHATNRRDSEADDARHNTDHTASAPAVVARPNKSMFALTSLDQSGVSDSGEVSPITNGSLNNSLSTHPLHVSRSTAPQPSRYDNEPESNGPMLEEEEEDDEEHMDPTYARRRRQASAALSQQQPHTQRTLSSMLSAHSTSTNPISDVDAGSMDVNDAAVMQSVSLNSPSPRARGGVASNPDAGKNSSVAIKLMGMFARKKDVESQQQQQLSSSQSGQLTTQEYRNRDSIDSQASNNSDSSAQRKKKGLFSMVKGVLKVKRSRSESPHGQASADAAYEAISNASGSHGTSGAIPRPSSFSLLTRRSSKSNNNQPQPRSGYNSDDNASETDTIRSSVDGLHSNSPFPLEQIPSPVFRVSTIDDSQIPSASNSSSLMRSHSGIALTPDEPQMKRPSLTSSLDSAVPQASEALSSIESQHPPQPKELKKRFSGGFSGLAKSVGHALTRKGSKSKMSTESSAIPGSGSDVETDNLRPLPIYEMEKKDSTSVVSTASPASAQAASVMKEPIPSSSVLRASETKISASAQPFSNASLSNTVTGNSSSPWPSAVSHSSSTYDNKTIRNNVDSSANPSKPTVSAAVTSTVVESNDIEHHDHHHLHAKRNLPMPSTAPPKSAQFEHIQVLKATVAAERKSLGIEREEKSSVFTPRMQQRQHNDTELILDEILSPPTVTSSVTLNQLPSSASHPSTQAPSATSSGAIGSVSITMQPSQPQAIMRQSSSSSLQPQIIRLPRNGQGISKKLRASLVSGGVSADSASSISFSTRASLDLQPSSVQNRTPLRGSSRSLLQRDFNYENNQATSTEIPAKLIVNQGRMHSGDSSTSATVNKELLAKLRLRSAKVTSDNSHLLRRHQQQQQQLTPLSVDTLSAPVQSQSPVKAIGMPERSQVPMDEDLSTKPHRPQSKSSSVKPSVKLLISAWTSIKERVDPQSLFLTTTDLDRMHQIVEQVRQESHDRKVNKSFRFYDPERIRRLASGIRADMVAFYRDRPRTDSAHDLMSLPAPLFGQCAQLPAHAAPGQALHDPQLPQHQKRQFAVSDWAQAMGVRFNGNLQLRKGRTLRAQPRFFALMLSPNYNPNSLLLLPDHIVTSKLFDFNTVIVQEQQQIIQRKHALLRELKKQQQQPNNSNNNKQQIHDVYAVAPLHSNLIHFELVEYRKSTPALWGDIGTGFVRRYPLSQLHSIKTDAKASRQGRDFSLHFSPSEDDLVVRKIRKSFSAADNANTATSATGDGINKTQAADPKKINSRNDKVKLQITKTPPIELGEEKPAASSTSVLNNSHVDQPDSVGEVGEDEEEIEVEELVEELVEVSDDDSKPAEIEDDNEASFNNEEDDAEDSSSLARRRVLFPEEEGRSSDEDSDSDAGRFVPEYLKAELAKQKNSPAKKKPSPAESVANRTPKAKKQVLKRSVIKKLIKRPKQHNELIAESADEGGAKKTDRSNELVIEEDAEIASETKDLVKGSEATKGEEKEEDVEEAEEEEKNVNPVKQKKAQQGEYSDEDDSERESEREMGSEISDEDNDEDDNASTITIAYQRHHSRDIVLKLRAESSEMRLTWITMLQRCIRDTLPLLEATSVAENTVELTHQRPTIERPSPLLNSAESTVNPDSSGIEVPVGKTGKSMANIAAAVVAAQRVTKQLNNRTSKRLSTNTIAY